MNDRTNAAPPGEIGYVFSDDDGNTVFWVFEGAVAAGVVDSETYEKINLARPNTFKIIGRTESVPRQVLGFRSGLDPAIADAVKQQFLQMHLSEAGKAVLEIAKTSLFDEFPDGVEPTFARMSQILTRLDGG